MYRLFLNYIIYYHFNYLFSFTSFKIAYYLSGLWLVELQSQLIRSVNDSSFIYLFFYSLFSYTASINEWQVCLGKFLKNS